MSLDGSQSPAVQSGKVLVYDGDCPMCESLSRTFVRLGWVPEERREPFQLFEGDTAAALRDAGIHNEIAVRDAASGEIRTGARGILWLWRDTWFRWGAALLSVPPFVWLLTFFYRLTAYNRRAIAPPRPMGIACDCDPDDHAGYQLAFVVLTGAFALVVAQWFALRSVAIRGPNAYPAGIWLTVGFGLCWLPPVVHALLAGAPRLRALTHAAWVLACAAVFLLPAIGYSYITDAGVRFVAWICSTVALAWPRFVYAARNEKLGVSFAWRWWWNALLVAGIAVYLTASILAGVDFTTS